MRSPQECGKWWEEVNDVNVKGSGSEKQTHGNLTKQLEMEIEHGHKYEEDHSPNTAVHETEVIGDDAGHLDMRKEG